MCNVIMQENLFFYPIGFKHFLHTFLNLNFNKRAQRALGCSPEENVKGQGEAIYWGPLMLSTKYW